MIRASGPWTDGLSIARRARYGGAENEQTSKDSICRAPAGAAARRLRRQPVRPSQRGRGNARGGRGRPRRLQGHGDGVPGRQLPHQLGHHRRANHRGLHAIQRLDSSAMKWAGRRSCDRNDMEEEKMSRKWLSYLGAHTVFNTGADTEVAALHHQVSLGYAQRESDKLHETERKNILERIEQA